MNNPFEERDEIETMLALIWYPSTCGSPKLGVGYCSPMFRDTPSSRVCQDEADEADEADRRILALKARAIDACIDGLPTWQMRVAVELRAANAAGAHVWRNARLTPEELAEAWQEARTLLETAFLGRGLLETVAKAAA
jgi:hypothetical protein